MDGWNYTTWPPDRRAIIPVCIDITMQTVTKQAVLGHVFCVSQWADAEDSVALDA